MIGFAALVLLVALTFAVVNLCRELARRALRARRAAAWRHLNRFRR